MRPTGLIQSEGFAPLPFQQPAPQPRSSKLLRIVIACWLLGGLAFLVFKLIGAKADSSPTTVPSPTAPTASSDDLIRHLETLDRRLADAAAKIHRAEDMIDRTVPALDQNYLLIESKRLKTAAAVADDARRNLEQSREELETMLSATRKYTHQ